MSEEAKQPSDKCPAREQAIAIQYQEQTGAPKILAMGVGELAKKILELAEEHEIPVARDGELVQLLTKVKTGHDIPPEAIKLLAELISFLYNLDKQYQAA